MKELETAMPIVRLTPITTLVKLAAEGKYASVAHNLPGDVMTADFAFTFNGEPAGEVFKRPEWDHIHGSGHTSEVYAPGNATGWAVMFGVDDRKPIVVNGNWAIIRL